MTIRFNRHAVLSATAVLAVSALANAKPGTHAPAVATWDTRASSVVLGGGLGVAGAATYNHGSYYANFTNTSGVLSSQFGVHYVGQREPDLGSEKSPALYGASGTATAVFNFPLAGRYDDGLQRLGLGMYLGGAPTVLISGPQNFLSAPLVAGFGLPWSPAKFITITPWIEGSFSLDLDSRLKKVKYDPSLAKDYVSVDQDKLNAAIAAATADGNATQEELAKAVADATTIDFTADDARKVVGDLVELDFGAHLGARAGLMLSMHAGTTLDFNINLMQTWLGTAFGSGNATVLGASVLLHWDAVVPGALPPDKRLEREPCDAVERRFKTCNESYEWLRPPDAKRAKKCLADEKARAEKAKTAPPEPPAPAQPTTPVDAPSKSTEPSAPVKPPEPTTPPPPAEPVRQPEGGVPPPPTPPAGTRRFPD